LLSEIIPGRVTVRPVSWTLRSFGFYFLFRYATGGLLVKHLIFMRHRSPLLYNAVSNLSSLIFGSLPKDDDHSSQRTEVMKGFFFKIHHHYHATVGLHTADQDRPHHRYARGRATLALRPLLLGHREEPSDLFAPVRW